MHRRLQPGVQAGKRAGEAADFIRDHSMAESTVFIHVLIRIDQHLVHLGREAPDHPLHHRLAVQQLQALVDAAHAAALAAGENDAAHLAHENGFYE